MHEKRERHHSRGNRLNPLVLALMFLICPGDDIALVGASLIASTNINQEDIVAIIPESPRVEPVFRRIQ